jgi:hypothetical protein
MPNGTANAPATNTIGAAHSVERCTRRNEGSPEELEKAAYFKFEQSTL